MSEIEIKPEIKPEIEPEIEPEMTELAKEWYAYISKEKQKKELKIILPIETVDELPVIVEIEFALAKEIDKSVSLCIYTDKKCDVTYYNSRFFLYSKQISCDEESKNWSISMLEKSIINLRSCLNNLKFNCYASRFDYNGYSNMNLLKNIFKGPNITPKDEACCVCHDDTKCKTKCGHNLCLRCWSKLKLEKICDRCGDDACECGFVIIEGHTCPICRSFMELNIW